VLQHATSEQPGAVLVALHALVAAGHCTLPAHTVATWFTHAWSQAVWQQYGSTAQMALQHVASAQPGLVLAVTQELVAAGHCTTVHSAAASLTQVWSHAVLQQ
jgi:hypothetical protein